MINQWFDFIWFGCLTHYGACFFFSPKTLLFSIHLRPYQTRTSRQTPFTTILFLHSTMHLSITCRRDTFTNHEWYHLVWHWPHSHSLTRHDGHRHVYLHTIQLLQPRIFLQIIKHSTYDTTLNPTQTMHSHSETAKLMTVTVSNHSIFTAIHPLIKVRKWANIGSAMQQSTSYAILSQSQAIAIITLTVTFVLSLISYAVIGALSLCYTRSGYALWPHWHLTASMNATQSQFETAKLTENKLTNHSLLVLGLGQWRVSEQSSMITFAHDSSQ